MWHVYLLVRLSKMVVDHSQIILFYSYLYHLLFCSHFMSIVNNYWAEIIMVMFSEMHGT